MRLACAALVALCCMGGGAAGEAVTGRVFVDHNGDGVHQPDEPGLPGVAVANGVDVVATDPSGRYRLPGSGRERIVSVCKPRGYTAPLDRFHRPAWWKRISASDERTVDFVLQPREEPDTFDVIVLADPQPRDRRELDYFRRDVVEDIARRPAEQRAAFGVTLGDLTYGDLSLLGPVADSTATLKHPWFQVIGNHDLDFDAPLPEGETESFNALFGPTTYSFDYGPAHFIVLRNVEVERDPASSRRYRGVFNDDVLAFVQNDLAHVPRERLVVLLMHCPLPFTQRHEALLRLLEGRPSTLSLAGHGHEHRHFFLDVDGNPAVEGGHHAVMAVTASGAVWGGSPDHRVIPHATMTCGAPNGWMRLLINRDRYQLFFVPASMPEQHQIRVSYSGQGVDRGKSPIEIYANVFNGSPRTDVRMRVGRGAWRTMDAAPVPDPLVRDLMARESGLQPPRGRPIGSIPRPSFHLWRSTLPHDLPPGLHVLDVRATDPMFGQVAARSMIEILEVKGTPDADD